MEFVVNEVKSNWALCQKIQWLGCIIDLQKQGLFVPDHKLLALRSMLRVALGTKEMSARNIARIVGKIISMSPALGPVARFMTRSLYGMIHSCWRWCDLLKVTPESLQELLFWEQWVQAFNGQPIWHSPAVVRVVYSDASKIDYGGYTVMHGMHTVQGCWSEHEAGQSSTWRELVAVSRVFLQIACKLRGTRMWCTSCRLGVVNPTCRQKQLRCFNFVCSTRSGWSLNGSLENKIS